MIKFFSSLLLASVLFFTTSSFTPDHTTPVEKKEGIKLSWHTDFQKANEESIKTGKPIFGFFTGSDWCGWCVRLQKAVFSKDDFVNWANENVILLELDFPKRTPQPEELKNQNTQLARAFNVRGYPTVWIFKANHNSETNQINLEPWGSTGYPQGAIKGKEEVKFLADVEQIFATQKK